MKKSKDVHLMINSAQKRNPVLKKIKLARKFEDEIYVHFLFKFLKVGVDYLSLDFFKNKRETLLLILEYSEKGERGDSIGDINYLALICDMDEDDTELIQSATILALRFRFRVLLFENDDAFVQFMTNLGRKSSNQVFKDRKRKERFG